MKTPPLHGGAGNTSLQINTDRAVALQNYHANQLAEAKNKYDAIVALIEKRNRYFENEIKVIEAMAVINEATASENDAIDIELLGKIEKYLSNLNSNTFHASNEVAQYIKLFTMTNTIKLLCEVINYFVSSTGSSKKSNPVTMVKLATQIANVDPFFKMVELFMIFRDGITGELSSEGTNFNKIDIETFHDWKRNHRNRMADYWELNASKNKAEAGDSNYSKIVDPKLQKLEAYRRELTQKMNIKEEVETKSKQK